MSTACVYIFMPVCLYDCLYACVVVHASAVRAERRHVTPETFYSPASSVERLENCGDHRAGTH